MSNKEKTDGMRMSQVLAGALAAVTAALLGSTMGVAGTVVGAGLASVVSTVGGALYLRSIERTRESVRTVRAMVVGKTGDATVLVSSQDPEDGEEPPSAGEEVDAEAVTPDDEPESAADSADSAAGSGRRRLRWPMIVAGSLAAFVIGMLAVTGVEWLRGEPLSGGTGTTFGTIVDPHREGDTRQDQPEAPPASTSTEPGAPSSEPAPSTSTTTGPASTQPTSSTPPSESSEPPSTPPVTTTTEVEPPGGSINPTN